MIENKEAQSDEMNDSNHKETETENENAKKEEPESDQMGDDDPETNRELTNEEKVRLAKIRNIEMIEKEFASLKDLYFSEKMESLQKELELIGDGTHLKFLEKLKELADKRDKEIELANRWRAYQIQNINTVFAQKKVQADTELNFGKCIKKKKKFSDNLFFFYTKIKKQFTILYIL